MYPINYAIFVKANIISQNRIIEKKNYIKSELKKKLHQSIKNKKITINYKTNILQHKKCRKNVKTKPTNYKPTAYRPIIFETKYRFKKKC